MGLDGGSEATVMGCRALGVWVGGWTGDGGGVQPWAVGRGGWGLPVPRGLGGWGAEPGCIWGGDTHAVSHIHRPPPLRRVARKEKRGTCTPSHPPPVVSYWGGLTGLTGLLCRVGGRVPGTPLHTGGRGTWVPVYPPPTGVPAGTGEPPQRLGQTWVSFSFGCRLCSGVCVGGGDTPVCRR